MFLVFLCLCFYVPCSVTIHVTLSCSYLCVSFLCMAVSTFCLCLCLLVPSQSMSPCSFHLLPCLSKPVMHICMLPPLLFCLCFCFNPFNISTYLCSHLCLFQYIQASKTTLKTHFTHKRPLLLIQISFHTHTDILHCIH